MVDRAKQSGFNTVIVVITDGVRLQHAPWKPQMDAWTKQELKKWVDNTEKLGIEVVPELKLLSHQEKLFQGDYSELMYNKATYDPQNEEVYQKVYALLDEVISLINPKAIHIGHDEVVGWNKRHAQRKISNGSPLPAKLFIEDTLALHGYLKKRGIKTWMWGDMLISPDEFPDMLGRNLHGSMSGYGKDVRGKLPKDIVICDWHYFDKQEPFSSLQTMVKEGFKVIGSTWKQEQTIKNFSRYASQNGAEGMIATTWFHVQKREWDVVERIIKVSGEQFLKDFPHSK